MSKGESNYNDLAEKWSILSNNIGRNDPQPSNYYPEWDGNIPQSNSTHKTPPTFSSSQNYTNITDFEILFDILNIIITTNLREVNVAYLKLARKYDPDKYNALREFTEVEGTETFKIISSIYEDLKDSSLLY